MLNTVWEVLTCGSVQKGTKETLFGTTYMEELDEDKPEAGAPSKTTTEVFC